MFVFPKLSKVCEDEEEVKPPPPVLAMAIMSRDTGMKEGNAAPEVETISPKSDPPPLPAVETAEKIVAEPVPEVIEEIADEIVMPCEPTVETFKDHISAIPEELEVELIPEESTTEPDSSSKVPMPMDDPRIKNLALDIEMIRDDIRVLKDFILMLLTS